MLINEIYSTWSGMTAKEYKDFKGIRKENLRDNMTDIEMLLTDLGEITTRDIAESLKPQGLHDNLKVALRGGNVSRIAREYYEKETGKSAITRNNTIGNRYNNIKKIK